MCASSWSLAKVILLWSTVTFDLRSPQKDTKYL